MKETRKQFQPSSWYYKAYFGKSNSIIHHFHKRRINKLVSLIPKECKSALDAACGSGILSYILTKKGLSVTGIDWNNNNIEFARGKVPEGIFDTGDLRYTQTVIKSKSISQYDIVICSDVLEHFSEDDLKKVLTNLVPLIKKEGFLLVSYPSWLYHCLEPFWFKVRELMYPKYTFDDEEIHRTIKEQTLSGILSNLKMRKLNKLNFAFLIDFITFQKV